MVSLLRRRAMMVQAGGRRLPEGYTEVEYLQGTGTQYILTTIVPRNTCVEADFKFGSIASGTDGSIIGKYEVDDQRYYALAKDARNRFKFSTRKNKNAWSATTFNTNRHQTIFNDADHRAYFDGSLKATNSDFSCTGGTTPLTIFARNNSTGVEFITPVTIYSLKVTDNDTGNILGEFVPCIRDSDNKAGMYDLATSQFYGNDGTGDFIAGDPV